MVDYGEAAAQADPRAVKRDVNLAAVVMSYGVGLEPDEDERLVGHCPFHDDEHMSFAVWRWTNGEWACGCWACDFHTGDIFDFVQRWHGYPSGRDGFRRGMEKVRELRDTVDMDAAPSPDARKRSEPPDLGKMLARCKPGDNWALVQLLHDRGVDVPAAWIEEEFRVGCAGGEVLIPHFSQDAELVGIKRRAPEDGWTPRAVKGCKLDELYGAWRAGGGRHEVVVCEGESDVWTVAWLLDGLPYDVVGLPSGAAAHPRVDWVDFLHGRDVTLLFDADRAGREGGVRWAAHAGKVTRSLKIACLPDGSDATSAGPGETRRAIDEAWPFVDPKELQVYESDGKYWRRTAEDKPEMCISDFALRLEKLVIMRDGGIVFEVTVPGKDSAQFLTGMELASTERMRRWCADRLMAWKGTVRDLSDLLELLKAQSLFIPRVRGTDVAGLHGEAFVLPGSSIGSSGWGYVPPENDIDIGHALSLDGEDWDRALLKALTKLHDAEVITPILGWVAAAPLRSTVPKFPVLGVTGGSGFGKTTLLQTILAALGFWTDNPITLTGATAHGIHSYVGSTNSFPIWVDEYRPGARVEARLALDQIIRDSWDGSATIKGGMSENRMKIKQLPARAPLVVSGEDSFNETSHAERMVMVPVPMRGKSEKALRRAQSMARAGFGGAYLEWLLRTRARDMLPAAPDIPDRQRQARAVAEWGYGLLDQFAREVCGYGLRAYDGRLVKAAHEAVEETPVITDAVIEALDVEDSARRPIAWRVEGTDDVCVRPMALCTWADAKSDFVFPGRSKAVATWLRQRYGAREVKHPIYGRALLCRGLLKGVYEQIPDVLD